MASNPSKFSFTLEEFDFDRVFGFKIVAGLVVGLETLLVASDFGLETVADWVGAIAMIAFSRYYFDVSGQVFVIVILTVAAAEAALALGLVVLLYRRKETLSAEAWSELKE